MALIIQTEVMKSDYVPYERPPQPYTLWSAIPRGLQSFVVDTQALDLISVGNTALLQLTATLPPNFGYVMMDASLTLAMAAAGTEWVAFNLNLQNFYRANSMISTGLAADWTQGMVSAAQDNSTKTMERSQPWPSFPIVAPIGTSGILVVMSAYNNNANARAVGTINSYISFWQFDLEQIRKFPINTPQPTHSR